MILLEKGKERGSGKLSFTKAKGMRGAQGKRNEHGDDYCVTWEPVSVADLANDPEIVKREATIAAILEMLRQPSVGMQRTRNPSPGWTTNEVHNELDRLKHLPGSEARDVYTNTTRDVKPLLEDLAKDRVIVDLSLNEGSIRYWSLP